MIVVSGAAGKTGLAVIGALAQKNKAVRAFVKSEEQAAAALAAGATQVVYGDMREPAAWREALQGARVLYHIGPNMHPEEMGMGLAAVAQAVEAGLEQFVFHSVLHPQTEAMAHHWHKLRVEEALLASGLAFTILQPAAYMQNILGSWELMREEGIYRVPYPTSTRLSLVHLADVAEVAARVLQETGHAGATYELVGTEALTQNEVAAVLGEALGWELQAQEVELSEWRRDAEARGMGGFALETLLSMFRYYAEHGFVGNPGVLGWLLGRAPRTLADFGRELQRGQDGGRQTS